MKQSSIFCPRRFARLTFNDLLANKNSLFISVLAVIVFWSLYRSLFFMHANAFPVERNQAFLGSDLFLFGLALFISGLILTSRSFKEMHRFQLAYHYLTLPCSNFERFLSKLFITSVGYLVLLLGLFFVHGIILGFAFSTNVPFPIFDLWLWVIIGCYLATHSLFFLGAAFFKKYNFLKTYLALHAIFLLNAIPAAIAEHFGLDNSAALIAFWIAMMPLFWFLTFVRVKKYEIN